MEEKHTIIGYFTSSQHLFSTFSSSLSSDAEAISSLLVLPVIPGYCIFQVFNRLKTIREEFFSLPVTAEGRNFLTAPEAWSVNIFIVREWRVNVHLKIFLKLKIFLSQYLKIPLQRRWDFSNHQLFCSSAWRGLPDWKRKHFKVESTLVSSEVKRKSK